jgi:hypothetical protein
MKTAIVIGCASCVEADLASALSLFTPDVYIGVNHAGMDFEQVEHWASCHIASFPQWLKIRAEKGFQAPQVWVNKGKNIDPEHKCLNPMFADYWEGSSGALGVAVAKGLGCGRIALCGIPMTDTAHYYSEVAFDYASVYQGSWLKNIDKLNGVRSMSGWSAELLGIPDREWLGLVEPKRTKKNKVAEMGDGKLS